ncbi:MAG TPA: hypothetical protein PKD90_02195 [Phnomibacter sp.]|nr:hypothetical protein [Phnomibacter sp.]
MKTLFTTLAAFIITASTSFANGNKTNLSSTNATAVSMASLLTENKQLRQQLEALANEAFEMESRLQFEQTMARLAENLTNARQQEALQEMEATARFNRSMNNLFANLTAFDAQEETQSQVQFEQTMQNLMQQLEQGRQQEKQAEAQAKANFETTMGHLFAQLKG